MFAWVEKTAIMEAVRKEEDHENNHPGKRRKRNRLARQCGKDRYASRLFLNYFFLHLHL